MRPTARLFSQVTHASPRRAQTIAFIGLGRMGSEMAYNLFSKTLVESSGKAEFVVCDALIDAARAFSANLTRQFPGVKIRVAATPAE